MDKERWYAYWLARLEGMSSRRKWELHQALGSAEAVYYIEETRKRADQDITDEEADLIAAGRNGEKWKEEYARMEAQGIRMVCRADPDYPARLRELPGMPYALYHRGRMPEEGRRTVAVVGARRCSPYGEKLTLEFAEALAKRGVQIVSGMARGIDGAAHRGALNVRGDTFAVLGCGADVCYPGEHKGLYQDLLDRGGVLSEYPPGKQPLPHHFPARNRIISALSDVVLVMEAKEKSGSLITADMALEQGRDVYALPGPVNAPLSRGCNRLIRQGAGILLDAEDLLEELQIAEKEEDGKKREKKNKNEIMLETAENLVYSKLDLYPRGREEILQLTGLAPQELAGILVSLELKGYIKELSKNYYVRR